MATQRNGGTQPAAPLTQADIPAVVQAVTAALQDQLKEHCLAEGNHDPTDTGEGMSAQADKLLLISTVTVLPFRCLFNVIKAQHLAR